MPQSEFVGIDEYQHYLSVNELGLAFDVLVEVGASQRATSAFWQTLQSAAFEMKLMVDPGPHSASVSTINTWVKNPDLYPCPCCGYLVFDEGPGSYDICPVCGWEDDLSQLRFTGMGGANAPLIDCQQAVAQLPASSGASAAAAKHSYSLEPNWRPLDPSRDAIERPEPGVDYGKTYADDATVYYYWRDVSG
ncbi:MAG: CPCC family cysteine-rich protein [Actinomycetota bacterium]